MKTVAVKVVILGSQGVGKTALVTRYESRAFRPNTSSTIGASFSNLDVVVAKTKVKMQVWDTAGQERFRSMAPMYYRGANAAFLVYDITNFSTFVDVKSWVHELHTRVGDGLMLVVVGNKVDLDSRRSVDQAQALEYATSIGAAFIETSALENSGVEDMFRLVAAEMVIRAEQDSDPALTVYPAEKDDVRGRTSAVSLHDSRVQERQTCC